MPFGMSKDEKTRIVYRNRPRPKTGKGHGRRGLIAQANHAIRQIGHGAARAAGPLMVGAGGVLLVVTVGARTVAAAKSKSALTAKSEMQGLGSDILEIAVPAGLLIVGGVATEKAVGSAVH